MATQKEYTLISLFTGAGGLDLGFENEGFKLIECVEIDEHCGKTIRHNRPGWNLVNSDVCRYTPEYREVDVLTAGFPCQGFSLGGNRDINDIRNVLYKEVLRVSKIVNPRLIVLENVLNLRTMKFPGTKLSAAEYIASEFESIGYKIFFDAFKVCHFDTPQTRRRFVFYCFRDTPPPGYHLPKPGKVTSIRKYLYDLSNGPLVQLPNHDIQWGFKSKVHKETNQPFDPNEEIVPVRFSRTGSDGNPIRSFDAPFPAIDTATIWGWAQGNVFARRVPKDRTNGQYIRNPEATVTLWRIDASRLRSFTFREYARLQTFPDDWEFFGANKRDIHKQIGNAVPVNFAKHLARNAHNALSAIDMNSSFSDELPESSQLLLPMY